MTQNHPVVTTRAGAVRGRRREGSAAFLGIPYAQAPVGELRFAAPRRRTPWDGVRDAGGYGPTAQIEPLATVTTIPEPTTPGDDILNLNVFTPAPGDREARLPVLFWIHGGGYLAGCQNSSWYDGDTFNADGIVVVAAGYRLGAHAWLHLPGSPDNRGNLDWVAALTWVAENIEAFGGDPARVTVAGQSAGGGAVLNLLAMPSAAGLFHRALPISAALGTEDPAVAHATARRFADLVKVPATELSARRLHEASKALSGPRLAFTPFADGTVLPRPVLDALKAGAGSGIPMLAGTTRHEFNHGDAGQEITDAVFRRPAVRVARARHGQAPTWMYEFAWPSSPSGLATHCVDLPFWWNRLSGERVHEATGPNPPQALAEAMHAAMVRFVRGEDPGWPAWDGHTAMRWSGESRSDQDPFADVANSV